jgi:hypothetical protein
MLTSTETPSTEDRTPSKEAYDKAFDELVLILFKEYRKINQAKAKEPTEQII